MEWKDATVYSRSDNERKPNTYSVTCGPVRIVVTNDHIHYRGTWVSHCDPLFDTKKLQAQSLDDAKAEALQMARDWVSRAATALWPT